MNFKRGDFPKRLGKEGFTRSREDREGIDLAFGDSAFMDNWW